MLHLQVQIGAIPENFNTIPSQHTFLLSSSDEKLQSLQGGRTILRQRLVFIASSPATESLRVNLWNYATELRDEHFQTRPKKTEAARGGRGFFVATLADFGLTG
jgi:hypothetical protein